MRGQFAFESQFMSDALASSGSALGLIFLLGLRHGLDPDHIAVIDNLTFRAMAERPPIARWIGSLFAFGHSLSVTAVAIGASLLAAQFGFPAWVHAAVDWAVIGLLVVVGALNLWALLRQGPYTPVGWRQGVAPRALRATSNPAAVVATGVIFGLVFDTATQAAAWGLAASSTAGVRGAILVSAAFSAGMIFTDTADSQIVAHLLRPGGDASGVLRYRRAVGWVIVALSFGMAGYALAIKVFRIDDLPYRLVSALGLTMAMVVVATLLASRRRADKLQHPT